MRHFFSYDGPLVQALNKLVDFVWLNILTIICCIPLITIGASISACHYTILQMRSDYNSVTSLYFRSFRQNFKQGTILSLIFLLGIVVLIAGILLCDFLGNGIILLIKLLNIIVTLLFILMYTWTFQLQARYINRVKTTLTNALALTLGWPIISLFSLIAYAIPLFLVYCFPGYFLPLWGCAGLVLPSWLCSKLCSRTLSKVTTYQNSEDTP